TAGRRRAADERDRDLPRRHVLLLARALRLQAHPDGAGAAARDRGRQAVGALRGVPMKVLDGHFALYRDKYGVDGLFSLNDKREAVLLLTDEPPLQMLYDHFKAEKAEDDPIPSEQKLRNILKRWKRETDKLAEEPAPFCFGDDDR